MDRVQKEHPDVTKEDAAHALANPIRTMPRFGTDPLEFVGIGPDKDGEMIEFVANKRFVEGREMWLIFHAQRPPQEPIKRELGFMPGKREKDRSERERRGRNERRGTLQDVRHNP